MFGLCGNSTNSWRGNLWKEWVNLHDRKMGDRGQQDHESDSGKHLHTSTWKIRTTHMHVYIYIYICMCICIYIWLYIYIYMDIYIYIYNIRIHTWRKSWSSFKQQNDSSISNIGYTTMWWVIFLTNLYYHLELHQRNMFIHQGKTNNHRDRTNSIIISMRIWPWGNRRRSHNLKIFEVWP